MNTAWLIFELDRNALWQMSLWHLAWVRKHMVTPCLEPFTLWTLVDELTRLNRDITSAGDRMEADSKVAQLLVLAV